MSTTEEQKCPLCLEEMDATDKRFRPCSCGYQLCILCFHRIVEESEKERTGAKCPACRALYDRDRIDNLQPEDVSNAPAPRKPSERPKQNDQREDNDRTISQTSAMSSHIQGSSGAPQQRPAVPFQAQQTAASHSTSTSSYHVPSGHPTANGTIPSRKHLVDVRVIQRNLVYVTGIPLAIAREDILRRQEYFGRYGKIVKVAINRSNSYNNSYNSSAYGPSASAYVTFERSECAQECIRSIDGLGLEGRTLKACFGTTKYCNAFLKNVPCNNPDCLYLHDVGNDQDSYTKEQMLHKNGKNGLDFHDATHATTLKNEGFGVSASIEGSYEHSGVWSSAQSISQDHEEPGHSVDDVVSSSDIHSRVPMPSKDHLDGSDKKRQPSLGNGHQNNNERDLHQYGQMGSFKQPANSFHSHHESLAHQNQSQSLSRMLGMSQTQASQYSNGKYTSGSKQLVQPRQVNNAVGNVLLDSVNRNKSQAQAQPQAQGQAQSQYGYYDPWASFVPPVLHTDQSNHQLSFAQLQGAKNAAAHSRFAFARNGDGNVSSEGQNFEFPRSHHSASSFYSESDDGMAKSNVGKREDETSAANVSTNILAAIPPSLLSLSSHVSTTPSSAVDNIERLRKNMSASDQELEEQRSALERMGLRGPRPTVTHQEEAPHHFSPSFSKGFPSISNGPDILQQLLQRDLPDESERRRQDSDDGFSAYGNADAGLRNKDVYHIPNATHDYQAQTSTSSSSSNNNNTLPRYTYSQGADGPGTESEGSRSSMYSRNGTGLINLGSEKSVSGEYINSIDREASKGRKSGKKVARRRQV